MMKVDIINIALMLLSVVIALLIPFELFLISYAVLGPLHYATEISWLQKKEYFIKNKKDWLALLFICIISAAIFLLVELWSYFQNSSIVAHFLKKQNLTKEAFANEISLLPSSLVFFTFISAFILTFIKDWFWRINSFALALFLVLLFKGTPNYVLIFGILLTTIIHVWLFTGIFMLSGAIKSKAISSYVAFAFFVICSISFIFISHSTYILEGKALQIISSFNNLNLNRALAKIFDLPFTANDLISSTNGLKIQSFIAFAYTYHYLNWFSKVEIIKWHEVSKKVLILCLLIWFVSVAAYSYDYYFGLMMLLFLSMLHVFLEFPLNFHSINVLIRKNK